MKGLSRYDKTPPPIHLFPILRLLRVKHYLKNFLIFLPMVFSGNLFNREPLVKSLLAFVAFSFVASIIYIVNDIRDIDSDRQHSVKCRRPLASGAITIPHAWTAVILLATVAAALNWAACGSNLLSWGILALYIALNLAYSMGAKNAALIDIFILALGYLLRLYYGAVVVQKDISNWMYLTILSMAFFLGMGKRRNELQKRGNTSRPVLKSYTPEFLDKNMYLYLGAAVVFYALWCESMVSGGQSGFLLWSVPVVILVCMRYSLLIERGGDGDPIEVVTRDPTLLALILVFATIVCSILYLPVLSRIFRSE